MRDQTAQVCRQSADDLASGGKKEEWREKRWGHGDDRRTGNREEERETLRDGCARCLGSQADDERRLAANERELEGGRLR